MGSQVRNPKYHELSDTDEITVNKTEELTLCLMTDVSGTITLNLPTNPEIGEMHDFLFDYSGPPKDTTVKLVASSFVGTPSYELTFAGPRKVRLVFCRKQVTRVGDYGSTDGRTFHSTTQTFFEGLHAGDILTVTTSGSDNEGNNIVVRSVTYQYNIVTDPMFPEAGPLDFEVTTAQGFWAVVDRENHDMIVRPTAIDLGTSVITPATGAYVIYNAVIVPPDDIIHTNDTFSVLWVVQTVPSLSTTGNIEFRSDITNGDESFTYDVKTTVLSIPASQNGGITILQTYPFPSNFASGVAIKLTAEVTSGDLECTFDTSLMAQLFKHRRPVIGS